MGCVDALGRLLDDEALRVAMGDAAFAMSHRFTWEHAQESFAHVLAAAMRHERIDAQDPDEQ